MLTDESLGTRGQVHLASIYAKGSKIDQDLRRANAAKDTWSATLESYRNENARYEEILAVRLTLSPSLASQFRIAH
jgi:cell shape-determining protein MreC